MTAQQQIVYDALTAFQDDGLTQGELSDLTGLRGSAARPRLLELQRMGYAVRTVTTRLTPSGKSAAVWKAKSGGTPLPTEPPTVRVPRELAERAARLLKTFSAANFTTAEEDDVVKQLCSLVLG